jgi:hypothetical protein
MPLLANKKTKVEYYVPADIWSEMKSKGLDRRYKLIDDTDLQQTVIKAPVGFTEPDFTIYPTDDGTEYYSYDDMTKDSIKEILEERGIEYKTNENKEQLFDKLVSNG